MKKIITLLMIIVSMSVFAEKLTTDGKNHLNELLGNYSRYSLVRLSLNSKRELILSVEPGDFIVTRLNNYIYQAHIIIPEENINQKQCFAYDTKYKALSFLKRCNSLEIDYRLQKIK